MFLFNNIPGRGKTVSSFLFIITKDEPLYSLFGRSVLI